MKVKELIARLHGFDMESEVIFRCDDDWYNGEIKTIHRERDEVILEPSHAYFVAGAFGSDTEEYYNMEYACSRAMELCLDEGVAHYVIDGYTGEILREFSSPYDVEKWELQTEEMFA